MKRVQTSLFFVAVMVVLALCGSAWGVESSEQIQGLISHWKFDEGSETTAYDSAGNNHGTVYGATWTTGKIDGALSFDGSYDYVAVGDKESLELQSFTLTFWSQNDHPEEDFQGGIAKGKVFGNVNEFSYKFQFRPNSAQAMITNTNNHFYALAPFYDSNWHMWTMTAGDGILSIYKDGVIQDSAPYTGPIDYIKNFNNFAIGAYTDGKYAFDGIIDDVRIYDRALSSEEIWQLYLPGAGPVSHWKFDEGSGTIAYDSAGDNDGTLVNGPLWTDGQIDGALGFDGVDDYVDFSRNIITTTEFTVSAWANHYGLGGGRKNTNPIFQQRDDYGHLNPHCIIILATESAGDSPYATATIQSSSGPLQKLSYPKRNYNEWHHYAMTVNSSDFIFYIDGVEVNRTPNNQPGDYVTSIDYVDIGRHRCNGRTNGFFHGVIDEVAIYDRALSAEEIQQLYQGELADLVGLEIVGPDEVAENFSASYKAIAYYDDDSTRDVTNSALWAVEPNTAANIDENGVLTTKDIVKHQSATILASYTEGDVAFDAEKAIDILAICPIGSALRFDGVDDYVDCGNDSSLDLGSGSFTLAAWVKTSVTSEWADVIICHYCGGHLGHYQLADITFDGSHHAQVGIRDNDLHLAKVIGTTNIEDGKWHYVVGVRGGDTLYLYVDGVSEGTPADASAVGDVVGLEPWTIGAAKDYRDIVKNYYNGLIDEVAIYNRALSAEEIQANMHRRLAGNEPGLVGYWDFDEGEGQIVYDLSVSGNDGQLGSTLSPDVSDPAWVDSDAPIGICSLYQIATMAVDRALWRKLALLDELLAALAEEWAAYEALEELLESGDYGDLNKGDIVKAKQKIHSAIRNEEQAIGVLEKSIEKLEDALSALEPPILNQPPNVTITKPQDGAVFGASETIEIEANAWDVDGSVVKVEFFADESKIGEDNDGTDGWKTSWYDHPVGSYSLTAKATDNDGATTTSPAVTITVVEVPPPGQASNPNPADGTTGVSPYANLSWTAGPNAVSHDVYFGMTSPGAFRGNQTATTFDPGTMAASTTYYWRIDEVNLWGTTTGTVWSFTTGGLR